MKVLIVSEGKHELGNEHRDQSLAALRTLVCRVVGQDLQCDLDTVRNVGRHITGGKGDRFKRKAIECMKQAEKRGYDAMVFLIDEDGDVDRRRQLDMAQEYVGIGIRRAIGLAIRTFDAWMLADETALSNALSARVQRQPDPEDIKDPKSHCRKLREDLGLGWGLTDMYEQIARIADLAIIEKRCPRGFGNFADRLRGLGV